MASYLEEEGGGRSGTDWRDFMEGGRGVRGTDCLVFDEDVRALVVLSGSKESHETNSSKQTSANFACALPPPRTVCVSARDGGG